jgi:hypothetical protein
MPQHGHTGARAAAYFKGKATHTSQCGSLAGRPVVHIGRASSKTAPEPPGVATLRRGFSAAIDRHYQHTVSAHTKTTSSAPTTISATLPKVALPPAISL